MYSNEWENVFVTVGTTKFEKFIKAITSEESLEALKSRGCKKLTLQIGNGAFLPPSGFINGINIEFYRLKDSIAEDIRSADFVISHAGAGSCLETLGARRPLLVVINDDLMNNHQVEVALKFHEEGFLYYTTCDLLPETLRNINLAKLKEYSRPSPHRFITALDSVMGFS